jgi:flagellar assembly factor FliW
MNIKTTRFHEIEYKPEDVIRFPNGIIGFPDDKEFLLVLGPVSNLVAWLQSVTNPALALPVVSGHAFGPNYPDIDIDPIAERAGLGNPGDDTALLVVVAAPAGQPASVNLLAPIVVNSMTRTGAQVLLEGSRYTTRELFVLPPQESSDRASAPASPA